MKLEKLFETYTAYVLDPTSRTALANEFPPKYPEFIGHHVTMMFGIPKDTPAPQPADINVVGYADDGEGLEALVVEVNGTVERQDGGIYHITWSLDRSLGRKPAHSKQLVKQGYEDVPRTPVKTTGELLR